MHTQDVPTRVALFLPNLDGGGAERVMVNLAHGLCDRGIATDLVLVRAQGEYLDEVPRAARVVDLNSRGALHSLPGLIRFLRVNRPDVLVATSNHCNVVATLARRFGRIKTRLVLRQSNTLTGMPTPGIRHQIVLRLARHLYPLADVIVGGSEGASQDIRDWIRSNGHLVVTVPNPIVSSEMLDQAKAPIDHPWLQPGSPPVVLSVGRLSPEKDFATLLRAFAIVRRNRPVRLMILGEGPERPDLEALARDLGIETHVDLPGFASNPFAYMSRAVLFVLSSTSEGSPGALIQAMACGSPVVATDCDNGPREVLDGGRFGDLVPVGDVNGLAGAIDHSLEQQRRAPPSASWDRYRVESATEAYIGIMVGCHE